MNNKVLFIVIVFISGFSLSTYLYLPYVGIQDDLYVIDSSSLQDKSLDSIDCDAMRKSMLLKELDVVDTSVNRVSSYVNNETLTGQSSEMHVLSVYEGLPVVKVKKTNKPVTLFLSSGEATIWTVQLEEEARLDKIYIVDKVREIRIRRIAPKDINSKLSQVFLRKNSSLQDIEIIKFKVQKRSICNTYGYKWHPDRKGKFRSFIGTTRELTGLLEFSYQGLYSYGEFDLPFEIPIKALDVDVKHSINTSDNSDTEVKSRSEQFSEKIDDADKFVKFIEELIDKNVIPDSLPSKAKNVSGQLMELSPLKIRDIPITHVGKNGDFKCNIYEITLIVGDDKPDIIECLRNGHLIYAGDGKDIIESSWGNDIVYGGKGDDVIDTGWGSDIIIFNQGWGSDIVKKTCHFSRYRKEATLGGTGKGYGWKYTNFIVFGPDIYPKDIVWNENKLINKSTGDTIDFDGKCFNFVYFEDHKTKGL